MQCLVIPIEILRDFAIINIKIPETINLQAPNIKGSKEVTAILFNK